jgi:positive regulator of sigma E activity
MIERGKVIEVKDGTAVVEMPRTTRCGRCCACAAGQGGRMRLEADASSEVRLGDEVDVEIPTSMLGAIVKVFVLPLAAVLAGAILGNYLAVNYYPDARYRNLLPIGLALAFVLAAYGVIALVERRAARRPGGRPRIIPTGRTRPEGGRFQGPGEGES